MLGISMQGQAVMQNLVNIHFCAPKLGTALREQRPGMLYFVFNPKGVVVVVAHDLDEGDFVAQVITITRLDVSYSHFFNIS